MSMIIVLFGLIVVQQDILIILYNIVNVGINVFCKSCVEFVDDYYMILMDSFWIVVGLGIYMSCVVV